MSYLSALIGLLQDDAGSHKRHKTFYSKHIVRAEKDDAAIQDLDSYIASK